jgi:hypothetical protein
MMAEAAGDQRLLGAAHLGAPTVYTASGASVQAVDRPAIRRFWTGTEYALAYPRYRLLGRGAPLATAGLSLCDPSLPARHSGL